MRNFFSLRFASSIVYVQVCLSAINILDIIIYVARWCEKNLLKRSLIEHTSSWRNKLIILWTLNRQAKIFLRIWIYQAKFEKIARVTKCLVINNMKNSIENSVAIIRVIYLQCEEEKKLWDLVYVRDQNDNRGSTSIVWFYRKWNYLTMDSSFQHRTMTSNGYWILSILLAFVCDSSWSYMQTWVFAL